MSKNKQRKKDRKLRQSIEILKAQLSVNSPVEIKPVAFQTSTGVSASKTSVPKILENKMEVIDDKAIKKDLTKTIVLSAAAFGVVILLWMFNITSFRF